MRQSPALTNFTGGEWSPQMYGQIDLEQYQNACRLLRNFIARVTGGAIKRPGTIFISEVKDSTKDVRLVPFQYSTEQAYVIEMGGEYMRFLKDRGVISGVEIGIPYKEEDDINLVKFAQDKDLMYLFHRSYKPQILTRYDHDDWELKNMEYKNGPYLKANQSEEVGTNLIKNGDMEDDDDWVATGSPFYSGQTDDQKHEGEYSWSFIDDAADAGIKQDVTFTTVTDTVYRHRFRIYTAAGSVKIKIHQGNDSGTWLLEETIADIPKNQWTEYERTVKETSGGTGAYVEFLTAITANIEGYKSVYPPAHSDEYVKATSYFIDAQVQAYHATNPANALTGLRAGRTWFKDYVTKDMRFHIDLGSKELINSIYYENYHSNGGDVNYGVKAFTFWGSNDPSSFANLTYGTDTGWTEITVASNEMDKHASANAADPKYILVTATSKYRYYAFKFSSNWSGIHIGVSRIELQQAEYTNDPMIYIDMVEAYETDTITMTPSATTGSITLTASKAYFEDGHIGAFFQLTHGTGDAAVEGYCKITGITSSTVATAIVIIDFDATTATTEWREGAWSIKNGYPACACFYEQRLITASTDEDPDALWGSKQTEYDDFTPGTGDSDPLSYKLQSDIIRWLAPMGQLVVGTVNSEYRLGAQSSAESLTPTNIKITQQSRYGAANQDPISLGNAIIYSQRRGNADNYGKRVRELRYDYSHDAFQGTDLTLLAEHITGDGIKKICFMCSPFPIIWACTSDGRLIARTYEPDQNILAWHYHPMDGLVKDICIIPGENQDDLYMIVERTINGVAKKYIEVLSDLDFGDDLEDAYFVDCGLTYEGDPATVITGLDHLQREEVTYLADGIKGTATVGDVTVFEDDCTSLDNWTDASTDTASVTVSDGFLFDTGAGAAGDATAIISMDYQTSDLYTIKATTFFDTLGAHADNDRLVLSVPDGTFIFMVSFSTTGLYIYKESAATTILADLITYGSTATEQEWEFLVDRRNGDENATVTITLDGERVGEYDCDYITTSATPGIYWVLAGYTTDNIQAHLKSMEIVYNGSIELDTAAKKVHVGLPITSELQPLDLQADTQEGVAQGKVGRIHGVALYLYNTVGGEIGMDSSHTERIFQKEETAGEYEAFSGIKEGFNFKGNWQLEKQIYIKHDDPYPCTILSILPRMRIEDR